MKCAEVLPIARFPRGIDFFDYSIPESMTSSLSVGDYVEIPFRGQTLTGIVWKLTEANRPGLKEIGKVLGPSELRDSREQDFLVWFAKYYCVSLAHALTLLAVKPSSKETPSQEKSPLTQSPELPGSWEEYKTSDKPLVSLGLALDKKRILFRYLAYDLLERNKQGLFLLPTIHEAELLYQDLSSLFGNVVCFITGELGITQERLVRRSLKDESYKIAVGTRTALFSHLPSLDLLVLDNAERQEYKQYDLNPRYDARDVALKRSQLFNARLLYTSPAPRLEEMKACREGTMKLLDYSAPGNLALVSLVDEWKGGRHGWISERLEDAVRESLQHNKHVILFLNRKGTSKMVTCKECEHLFACEKCASPLTFFQKENLLKCIPCSTSAPLPARCPSCGGTSFRFPGLGTEKITQEAKKLFHSFPVLEITRESLRDPEVEKIVNQSKQSAKQPVIFVGTSALLIHSPELFAHVGCVGVIAADPIRHMKNFRSSEEQWQTLAFLQDLARQGQGEIILQAFDHTSPFLSEFSKSSYIPFSQKELQEREKYIWPPTCELIKLMCRKRKGFDSKGFLERIKGNLVSYIHEHNESSGAQISLYSPREESGSYTLLIRVSGTSIQRACDLLVSRIPPGVLIDRNPFEM